MVPFHLLRLRARSSVARAIPASAIFCAIALALLAGGAPGPLAAAEAKRDSGSYGVGGDGHYDGHYDGDDGDDGDDRSQTERAIGHGGGQSGTEGGYGQGGDGYRSYRDDDDDDDDDDESEDDDDESDDDDDGSEDDDDSDDDDDDDDSGPAEDPEKPSQPETPPSGEQPSVPTVPGKGRDNPRDGVGGDGDAGGGSAVDPVAQPDTTSDLPSAASGGGGATAPGSTTTETSPTTLRERLTRRAPADGALLLVRPGAPTGAGRDTTGVDVADVTASGAPEPAPAAGAGGFARVGADKTGRDGSVGATNRRGRARGREGSPVTRTVRDISEVVPDSLKAILAALAALSVLLGAGYILVSARARGLARQRRDLLNEVGLLQTALLPPVPKRLGALRTSVAYRPADGPGAGGDFYDALPLSGGRVGFILGDVSGHGRGALARTAFMRYTLRAYLEAGLEPRAALQVAGRVIDENLGGDFATVLLAVHDPETGSLTYASAGHPAPLVVGATTHDPVTAGSSPPIGIGERTGLRQTTVPLLPGSVACLFTDGLIEARTDDGILGRERLEKLLADLGPEPGAQQLIERVAGEARVLSDDMAAVIISPTAGVTAGLFRSEQLELSARELEGSIARRFLEACGLPADEVEVAERNARKLAERFGGAVIHVSFGNRLHAEVVPRNVESIEAASRRAVR